METARTLRFEYGSRGNGEESQSDTGAPEPNLKRPRIAETSIVEVHLVELIRDLEEANEDNDKHYGLFVWPSALLLSQFVAYQAASLCRGKTVLELGCGTGLPSILTALSGASKVYLTDRADADDIKRNAEANIKMNKLEGRAEFISLAWGAMHVSSEIISVLRSVEVILAADCFYQTEGLTAASVFSVFPGVYLTLIISYLQTLRR
ncbi:unnamed protein product [Phytophthora lilii]|uniref:Unnamed protein product n=1 Tax=Phytophthora lilii TaxID=2077276 RepID=A0A9W6WWY3_9STRA|nr:unnamed protein product [Phytophthora lilii]